MIIKPLVGVDDLFLGLERESVSRKLGRPDRIEADDHVDGTHEETWEYQQLALELVFSSDDDYRLGRITVMSEKATLNGCRLIGLPEGDFVARAKSAGLDVQLDDDFDGPKCRDYMCQRLNLSFWISEGVLENICVMPEFDKSGNNVMWPKEISEPPAGADAEDRAAQP